MKTDICSGSSTEHEEDRLIALVIGGNTGLFYQLVRPHQSRLRGVALALLGNEADADDVVQESLLKAFTHLKGFRGDAKLTTWHLSLSTPTRKNCGIEVMIR
jgi:RNA polymerase sigma-70 factor, ECF subfamily